ncbi:MAG: type IV toxin-antitoxin system AbiEi family antitoxin domain-containing protein, partial [Rhodoglobus sp.]
MKFVLDALETRGGVATTGELTRLGVDRQRLDIAWMYRRIVRVKRGVWALPTVAPEVIAAHRAGGRLACVSALAFHGVIDDAHSGLHIAAPSWVRRWRAPRGEDVVAHWS